MRRILGSFLPFSAFFAVLFFAVPVLAEEKANVIKVIRDDGSVVVIEMGDDGSSKATLEGSPQSPESAAQTEEAVPAEAVPEAAVDGQSYPRRAKPDVAAEAPPKPAKQPKKPKAAKIVPPKPAPERVIPEGTEITQELATQIALDNAPPSTKFSVYRTALEGAQVFLVLFQTENGPYEVIVDAFSGKVLSRQPVRVEEVQTKPGHLPPVAPATLPAAVTQE